MVAGDQLHDADPTPGMDRQRAFELPLLWAGQVETAPGVTSGWHHHERNESSLYVVRGVLRFEFEGHEGYLDAVAGDFVHVPAWTVHRESNPTGEPSLAVIARVGGGVPTVNVGEPAPSTKAIAEAVKSFVSAYNSAVEYIEAKTSEKPVKEPKTQEEANKGILFGDSGLTSLLSQMRTTLSESGMAALGVSTGAPNAAVTAAGSL